MIGLFLKNKRASVFIISFIAISSLMVAQSEGTSQLIPRDTSYNVTRVFNQIRAAYPYTIPAKDSLPEGILSGRNLVYASLSGIFY